MFNSKNHSWDRQRHLMHVEEEKDRAQLVRV